MQQHAIRQGFFCEGPATGAHGLTIFFPAAAEPIPLADSGACATTSGSDPGLQHVGLDLDLDLDVSMGTQTRVRMG
jgi:hypothetical protein